MESQRECQTEFTSVEETGITRLLKQLRLLSQELSADLTGSDVERHVKLCGKLVSQTRFTILCTSLQLHEARGDDRLYHQLSLLKLIMDKERRPFYRHLDAAPRIDHLNNLEV